MTGPISLTNAGSLPKISRPRSASALGLVGRLDVLHDPGVAAVVVARAQEVDHPLERAAATCARARSA